ncbi:DUF2935 domain-containing protein [Lysinibacillus agricola]|uniref:DUF2935 domain-containing protein n=1 Tax=Lysinibacillus agricola TaxID=2590012 RepID=A0ABX7ARW2_9BACI|nr:MULTISPECIES: DUF2935 domain-containing protein [Lysinibacillus]KOS59940.1 hypothetical protein AN161_25725 [Lysinibacillus sp. FJAT-14222]QQP11945.1 DUF2935 domain-containing protein [Lysinibacillus agricola]
MSNYVQHAVFEHRFWLGILRDHGQFIHDSLYPSEKEDIKRASSFIHQFSQLLAYVNSLDASNAVSFSLTVDESVEQFKQFKFLILRRQLTGNINIHLPPSFVNHMVNELEEYQNVLNYLKKGEVPPIFHELHHHLVWLLDASGHAGIIHDDLDGVERRLRQKSTTFAQHFEQFYLKAVELTGYLRSNIDAFPALNRFNQDVEIEMKLFKIFLRELEEMELSAEVLGTFTAPMADHMLREEQYYLSKLAQSRGEG